VAQGWTATPGYFRSAVTLVQLGNPCWARLPPDVTFRYQGSWTQDIWLPFAPGENVAVSSLCVRARENGTGPWMK